MSSSRWIDFRDIKANVSIRQVLDYYGIPYREVKGDKLLSACPIHQGDNDRAFHVDLRKNVFKCFTGCKQGGNVLDLVMALEDLPIRDAALKLQELFLDGEGASEDSRPARGSTGTEHRRSGPPARPEAAGGAPAPSRRSSGAVARRSPLSRSRPADHPHVEHKRPRVELEDEASVTRPDERRRRDQLTSGSAAHGMHRQQPVQPGPAQRNEALNLTLHLRREHPYLEHRGIGQDAIDEFGLGYCPRGILAGRIAIPIHNAAGELVAYAGRHPKGNAPKYKCPAGFHKSLELYSLHRAKHYAAEHGLVVVEGFFDTINLWQLGVHNAVALMGTELSATQEELLVAHTDRVVLLLDGDEAGRAATELLLSRLARRLFVKVVQLSDGVQPDDLRAEHPSLQEVVI